MALSRVHTTPADGTFSATGAAAWNAGHGLTGADVGGIPYCPTATSEATSANLTYSDTLTNSGPGFQVGTTGSSTGWKLGYGGISGYGGMWVSTQGTPSSANFAILSNGTDTYVQGTSALHLYVNNGEKMGFVSTAGAGPTIGAGTATTDVQALSITQTWNNAGVSFTGIKSNVTNTNSAAGSLLIDLQFASGTMFSVRKDGLITTGGTAGVASFGPGVVTSITVKNGIITAIS